MQTKHILLAAALASLWATTASATSAVTTASVNMRAGPSTQHSVIVAVPYGQPLTVIGCPTTSWCDVVWAQHRGWVSSGYIRYGAVAVTPAPATVYSVPPGVANRSDARRDARVGNRVDRRHDEWFDD